MYPYPNSSFHPIMAEKEAEFGKSQEENSFVHHRKSMPKLDWPSKPTSVSLFVQEFLQISQNTINQMKSFLESLQLTVNEGKYEGEDFIILIGTDGFNLEVSMKFQDKETPPILSLTPLRQGFISFLEFKEFSVHIPQVVRGNCWILPRYRLQVEYHTSKGVKTFCVLNDLAVNRDSSNGSLIINCSCNEFGFAQIIGDGLIVATPTGSTAYNKGAGGALVHPLLPVFLMTPICALSLSARPIVFPQSATLTISLERPKSLKQGRALEGDAMNSQQFASVSFDGKHAPFSFGEKLVVSLSPYKFRSVMIKKSIADWPVRLAQLMGWNDRKHQKALPSQDTS
ncbi:ATP-NAD kinase family protein [Tritrichomonas foetus]|uniref:ATP-NAD kinase family protein n=1 Tax=Tritrichomonas foetus TaxID=1144522 RepID=A0A1J4JK99_9EUKA|nr:ATP-NAD kinase family protein [Tritrichomonas foetus]|eukprot:OHS99568.1 ATP-NAD kinase family protein [Tritrichomonas foetus]